MGWFPHELHQTPGRAITQQPLQSASLHQDAIECLFLSEVGTRVREPVFRSLFTSYRKLLNIDASLCPTALGMSVRDWMVVQLPHA